MSADDRKLAIVKAALPLFARKGFAETTTRELARAAGVSEPLLYKHFPSKEALYLAIQNFSCAKTDLGAKPLADQSPSTATLVELVYYLMRALVLGQPEGAIGWDTRHRLMVKSFLEDGAFARLVYETRLDSFCARIEASLSAAIASGDAVRGPAVKGNGARFAHHVGAWISLARLPRKPAINYQASAGELLHQAVWFALRGMGLTDQALATYYNPKALSLAFAGHGHLAAQN